MSKKSESAWLIPDDWDPDGDWQCITLMWPNSPQWLRLLISILYTLTRGREWDRGSGTIKTAQQIGWAIFERNTPLTYCDGGAAELPEVIITHGGGIVIASEDDMGQVVTELKYDRETGELVVYYGHCCTERIPLRVTDLGGVMHDTAEPEMPDLPGEPPEGEYTACAKATAWWETWQGLVDTIYDAVEEMDSPVAAMRACNDRYPGISLGKSDFLMAYLAAGSVMVQGFVSEAENPTRMKTVLCRLAQITPDGPEGISSELYDRYKDTVLSVAQSYFHVLTFPTAFDYMVKVWYYTACAMGPGDSADITTLVASAADDDCSCPGDPSVGMDWYIDYNFEADNGLWTITEDDYLAGTGWRGTDDWWDGSRLNGLTKLQDPVAGDGVLRRIELTWSPGDTAGSPADYWQGSGLTAEVDAVVTTIATREHLRALGSGAHLFEGYIAYDAADDFKLSLDYSQGDLGQRIIVSRIRIWGTGIAPFSAG